jgi:hypothetical protein
MFSLNGAAHVSESPAWCAPTRRARPVAAKTVMRAAVFPALRAIIGVSRHANGA